MKTKDINKLVEHIYCSRSDQSKAVELIDVTADAYMKIFSPNTYDDALSVAESIITDIQGIIEERSNSAIMLGEPQQLELVGTYKNWIRGSNYEFDNLLSPEEKSLRKRRSAIGNVHSAIKALSWKQFEVFCAKILEIIGCEGARFSNASNDGGIDFYGRLTLEGRLNAYMPYGGIDRRANVWLVGQAKHFKNKIQPCVLREIIGSVELARAGGDSQRWEGLKLKPFDAAIVLLFTTSDFTSGSHKLSADSGILTMNGRQLATLICDTGFGFDTLDYFHPDTFLSLIDSLG